MKGGKKVEIFLASLQEKSKIFWRKRKKKCLHECVCEENAAM